jgi:transcriptional regulator with XRE-family HTH domain
MRLRRVELGISQHQLADRVGLAFQQIQKYEVGRNRVSAGRLHEIGHALNVPGWYFFEGLVDAETGSSPANDRASLSRLVNDPSMMRLLRTLVAMDDDQFRQQAVTIVTLMAGESQSRLSTT